MNVGAYIVVLTCALGCGADDPVPANSPLSWLRNRVFGSQQAEDRFLGRVAVATQSLIALVNDPVVVSEVRKYYVALLRNPDVERIVNSVRQPTRRRPGRRRGALATSSSTTMTTTTITTRTAATSAPSATSNIAKVTAGTPATTTSTSTTDSATTETQPAVNETTSEPGSVVEVNDTNEYHFFYDAKHVMRPPGALAELRERVRRHLNLVRMNDVDNCVSFLVCEMSRYPWRYGPLGVKVERFFR